MSAQAYIEERSTPVPWTGCWLWEQGLDTRGYGAAKVKRRAAKAHRVSYEAFVGPIPDGAFVLHRCDVKACVNPDHLYAGTHAENMDDLSRGRYHPKRKLTSEQVRAMRASTMTISELAEAHGMSRSTIWKVLRGVTYRHD